MTRAEVGQAVSRTRASALALVAVLAVAIAGCGRLGNGPLASDAVDKITVCGGPGGDHAVRASNGEVIQSLGVDWLVNEGDADITLTAVELVKPKHMSLIGAVVLPEQRPEDSMGVGLMNGFPPTDYAEGTDRHRKLWARNSIPAAGRVIEAGKRVNLIQGLSSSDDATMKGTRVTYTYRGESFWAQTTTKYDAGPRCMG